MDKIRRTYFLLNNKLLKSRDFIPEVINFGTTIYELIKVVRCVPVFFEQYLKRIENTLKLINRRPWFKQETLVERVRFIINANCVTDVDHLKIIISFDNEFYGQKQNLLLLYFVQAPIPTDEQYRNGVHTITLQAQRINPNAKIFQPKLRQKAQELIQQHSVYEVILLNPKGYITEGSRSNVFFVKDNQLFTAKLKDVLPGITRSNVIDLARQNGIDVVETDIHYDELSQFQAGFLTGTSRKIVPIRRIDDIEFDPQHSLIRKLMRLYDELIEQYVRTHAHLWQCSKC